MTDITKMLVVDGDEGVRDALQAYLSMQGYIVQSCGDADRALSLSGQHRFDAVIADSNLPRVNGIAFTRALRQRCPDALLIATCNLYPGDDVVNMADCILMQKPIIPSELLSVLRSQ